MTKNVKGKGRKERKKKKKVKNTNTEKRVPPPITIELIENTKQDVPAFSDVFSKKAS